MSSPSQVLVISYCEAKMDKEEWRRGKEAYQGGTYLGWCPQAITPMPCVQVTHCAVHLLAGTKNFNFRPNFRPGDFSRI